MLGWIFLALIVLMFGHAIYSLVESLRAEPPRKGRAVWEGVWIVVLGLLLLYNLQRLGIVQIPLP